MAVERVYVEDLTEAQRLFNAADPHCETCDGMGHTQPDGLDEITPCPCTGLTR